MLDMKETGTKITTRLSVVASTACPMSAVAGARGFEGPHFLFFHESERVFEHDQGVVDDDSHHQHQRQHRDAVQREVQRPHHAEGCDQRSTEWRPPR